MNKTNKIIIGIVVILIAVWGIWYGVSKKPAPVAEKEIIKVGAILPLTGQRAEGGRYDKNGLEMALEEINQNPQKNIQIKLIYEDSQYEPQLAVTAFNKLRDFDQVKYIIGPHGSSEVLAIAPIAEKNKIIVITPIAQSADITKAGDYIFRSQINVTLEAPILADFIYKKAQDKTVHIMLLNTDYGSSFLANFQPYYENLGGKIGLIEKYELKDADFRTQLTKIKSQNPEYIVLAAVPKSAAMIIKQAREMKITAQFFGTAPVEGKELLDIGSGAVEGFIYSYPYDESSPNLIMKDYREKYYSKYNERNEMYSASCYDTLNILSNCFEKVGPEVERVKKCIYDTQNYQGASGVLSFDQNGDITKPFIFKTIKNGQFVPYAE